MARTVNGPPGNERGMALITTTILALAGMAFVGAHLSTSLAKVRHVEQEIAERSAFNAAESGLNLAIQDVWNTYCSADPMDRVAALDGLDGKYEKEDQLALSKVCMGRSEFNVEIRNVRTEGAAYADVEFVARGQNLKASQTLVAVIRYGLAPSEVFEYAYFINNFGWLWGAGITMNGDVRSNGNFSCKNATVNGDIYASENPGIGAAGSIEGDSRMADLDWYNVHLGTYARPTNPSAPSEDLNGNEKLDAGEDTNGNGKLDLYEYKDGYSGISERKEFQPLIEMPYLGDLTIYKDLAIRKNGTLSQGGSVIVQSVLGDHGGEDENLFIIGTEDDPIVVDGPVVITNDVVLKGYITGRGTIYAGRNVHVIGDLIYKNPPKWKKPLTDQEAAKAANEVADMVGLAAKGNVVLGDYTDGGWLSTTKTYQSPPFTVPYVVDPSDVANGYESYTDEHGRPVFDGDYRGYDGGKKDDGGGGLEDRKYFESSLSDDLISDNADSALRQLDAIFYTNHMLTGKVGSCVFNGTIVARDEAIIYNGSLDINYDIRVKNGGYEFVDIFLPREPQYSVVYWGSSH